MEFTIQSWMVIGLVTVLVGLSGNLINSEDLSWFKRLQRPQWLTFEKAIPIIWTVIFICGAWSAYIVWEANPGSFRTWVLMVFYLVVEIVTISYTLVMYKTQSLLIGTIIGATGAVLAYLLALSVWPVSNWAVLLLVPYLIWSPIGTYTTWEMIKLNPADK